MIEILEKIIKNNKVEYCEGQKEFEEEQKALRFAVQSLRNGIEYLGAGKWTCEHEKRGVLGSDCPVCHIAWCEKRIEVLAKTERMIRKIEIKQHIIFEIITDNFYTSGEHNEFNRPVHLNKHEVIEIRYPYAWHFRTMDNHYFHATPKMIEINCIFFGEILSEVSWNNNANLYEIIRLHLYKGENEHQLLIRQGFEDEERRLILSGQKQWYSRRDDGR